MARGMPWKAADGIGGRCARTSSYNQFMFPRVLMRCLVFLLIGAVVSVAVAWGCVLLGGQPNFATLKYDQITEFARSRFQLDWPHSRFASSSGQSSTRLGFEETRVAGGSKVTGASVYHQLGEVLAGWPWRSLAGWDHVDVNGGRLNYSIRTPRYAHYPSRLLPLYPILPGLLANSILFGLCAWVFSGITRALWGHWRGLRNRCERCGHDLRGVNHQRCPECGGSV